MNEIHDQKRWSSAFDLREGAGDEVGARKSGEPLTTKTCWRCICSGVARASPSVLKIAPSMMISLLAEHHPFVGMAIFLGTTQAVRKRHNLIFIRGATI